MTHPALRAWAIRQARTIGGRPAALLMLLTALPGAPHEVQASPYGLGQALDLDPLEVLDLLDTLTEARLVSRTGDGAYTYRLALTAGTADRINA